MTGLVEALRVVSNNTYGVDRQAALDAAAALEAIEAEVARWREHADLRRRTNGFADSHAQGIDGCAEAIDAILRLHKE